MAYKIVQRSDSFMKASMEVILKIIADKNLTREISNRQKGYLTIDYEVEGTDVDICFYDFSNNVPNKCDIYMDGVIDRYSKNNVVKDLYEGFEKRYRELKENNQQKSEQARLEEYEKHVTIEQPELEECKKRAITGRSI